MHAEHKTYVNVLLSMALRDIRNRYVGTYMGLAWALIGPVLQALVPALVFSILMTGRLGPGYGDAPFVLFYFAGFSVWTLLADTLNRGGWIIRENGSLVTKTTIPKTIFPIVAFTSGLPTHAVLLGVTLLLCEIYGVGFGWGILVLPVYFLLTTVFVLGLVKIHAALSVFISDLPHLAPVVLVAWFFMTPVLYSPDLVLKNAPPLARLILLDINPMAHLVEGYRICLLSPVPEFHVKELALLGVFVMAVYVIGSKWFRALQDSFADVL